MAGRMPIVTLTTDFGTRDYYVAAMKAALLGVSPKVTIVDVSHEVDAHRIVHAAVLLRQVAGSFPGGTIHVVVVDPGVGTSRRIIAAQYAQQVVVAPDNGVVSLLHRDLPLMQLVEVSNRQYLAASVSDTFHGRDIFAPVAGHLSRGVPLEALGPPARQIEVLDIPQAALDRQGELHGQVLYADHFGNLVTNITRDDLMALLRRKAAPQACLGDRQVGPVVRTYGDVAPGATAALIGSSDLLELAVCRGRAVDVLAAGPGAAVTIR